MQRQSFLILCALIIFILLVSFSFLLAKEKPLWVDEHVSQMQTIERLSYAGLMRGEVLEGNTFPLTYIIQKAICDLTNFHSSPTWRGVYFVDDIDAQFVMRIHSIVFMSLAVVLIFYYFLSRYSGWAGCYALLVCLSSYMVWSYMAEARQYALWMFLTTSQILLFMHIFRMQNVKTHLWVWLFIIHILLSMTILFGFVQVCIISSLLWLFAERKWKRYIVLIGIVCAEISLFYYLFMVKLNFWIWGDPMAVIYASVPRDRLFIIGLSGGIVILYFLKAKGTIIEKFNRVMNKDSQWRHGASLMILTALFFSLAIVMLILFVIGESREGSNFAVSNRYFIFLSPIEIMATTLFPLYMMKIFGENKTIKGGIVLGLAGLLIYRLSRTIPLLSGYYQIKTFSQLFMG